MTKNKYKNLPKMHDSHQQERRSVKAFKNTLDESRFIIREESRDDYGVDFSIEVIISEELPSNYRGFVQLKSVSNSERMLLKDKSYSFKVEVKNLVYLLNQTNSLYVLYLEDKNILLWEWAENIEKYANDRTIDIYDTNKKGLNYRFSKILGSDGIDQIFNGIIMKSEMILDFNKSKSKLKDERTRLTDYNISLNSEISKNALKYYLIEIDKMGKMRDLKLISQYNSKELTYALREGIVTSRLADSIANLVEADFMLLTGSRDLSVLELSRLNSYIGEYHGE